MIALFCTFHALSFEVNFFRPEFPFNVFGHLISQKVCSFRTFSKLLNATVRNSIKLDMWRIYMYI